jgi:cytochrome c-type biogenesis protein CcmF
MLGTLGSFLILAAFVASILSGVAFYLAVHRPAEAPTWRRLGRGAWGVVAAGTVIPFALLVYAFATHQYQYAYVYQNSSNDLPAVFTFSATWAGQEGSFLLWIVLNSLIGLALLVWARRPVGGAAEVTRKTFEAPVMALMALGQAFMLSMVVGLRLGPLTIGASPFTTLLEKFPDAPFLQAGGIPADGSGLNDLLQNYWMAIHPPTLFVGFAMMMVPFAFAVAALWTRRYTEWVRPAVPWTLAAVLVLGVGIMMGGYWAYITLSFGGWWAWDPVENSSLVPWLFGVAAVHAMLVQKKSAAGHKSALLLSVASFMFVVYSTFLTRSGILGDVSVHSFVDLGLYNQLLLWIGTMGVLGFGLFAYRYRELPAPARPPATLSREGMIFSGALVLALIGLVVIIGTSAPILGRIFRDNPAAVAIQFYNTWTLPLGIALAALAGLGQLFWWKKMEVEDVNRALMKPLGLSVAATAAVLLFTPFVPATVDLPAQIAAQGPDRIEAAILGSVFWDAYGTSLLLLLLLFASFFALFGNGAVLLRVARGNLRMAGGSMAHVGMALFLFGVLGSGVFNRPLSDGQGANLRGDRDNFIITRGETKHVQGFVFTYTGQEPGPRGRPVYAMDVTDPRGRQFRATTKVYEAPTGQWIQNPHVQKFFEGDIYIATFPSAMMQPVGGSGQAGELVLRRGEAVSLDGGAYALRFVNYDLEPDRGRLDVPEERLEIAVGALLELVDMSTGDARRLAPIYAVLSDGSQHFAQNRVPEWGITVTFAGMQVEDNAVRILVEGADTAPEDWIVVQAYRKPMISLLWLGTLIITLGFGIAVFRRASEQRR